MLNDELALVLDDADLILEMFKPILKNYNRQNRLYLTNIVLYTDKFGRPKTMLKIRNNSGKFRRLGISAMVNSGLKGLISKNEKLKKKYINNFTHKVITLEARKLVSRCM